MANLKYPAGLKNKASLAWLGCLVTGMCPLLWFFPTYIHKEHYQGQTPRKTYGDDR